MATLTRFPRMRRWFGAAKSPSPPDPPASVAPPFEDVLPVRSPKALLFARRDKLNQIEELAGTTPLHFECYYLAALQRFAAFVQECPASESHHHAHVGGLLDHALEVAVTALKLRQGYLLPPGVPPEQAVHARDRWTYAVFAAALVHDAGKPAVDQIITVFGADGSTWRWNPWDRALSDDLNARWYRVAFVKTRSYHLHERVAPLLAPRLLVLIPSLSGLDSNRLVSRIPPLSIAYKWGCRKFRIRKSYAHSWVSPLYLTRHRGFKLVHAFKSHFSVGVDV